MKKVFLFTFMLLGLTLSTQAQDISKNVLGLRLGENDGFGGEISYQRSLDGNNRLELDLGWKNSKNTHALKLAGLYQWIWNIDGGFNWYAGVGGGVGNYENNDIDDNGVIFFAAGDLGLEYNFDFPLQLSLDIRPEIYFNSDDYKEKRNGPNLALGVRYRFD